MELAMIINLNRREATFQMHRVLLKPIKSFTQLREVQVLLDLFQSSKLCSGIEDPRIRNIEVPKSRYFSLGFWRSILTEVKLTLIININNTQNTGLK